MPFLAVLIASFLALYIVALLKDKDLDKQVKLMDDSFFDKLSNREDKNSYLESQLINPWIHEKYNREREKLFFYAVQVHKFFTLSSKAIRSNLYNLKYILYKTKDTDENTFISISPEDKELSFSHLFNSLLLLTPVLSTTFASVEKLFGSVKSPNVFGTLIIDEAGQSTPQAALGSMFRFRRTIVVGDPKQIEPVVTSELDLIKKTINTELLQHYQQKNLSVQGFADSINTIGTYLGEGDTRNWVGTPLNIHRRCISPMFDISNQLSYDNTMLKQSLNPKEDVEDKFVFPTSAWIQVKGNVASSIGKNYYVEQQAEEILKMIEIAFNNCSSEYPDIFIISPFTSVIYGMKKIIREKFSYLSKNENDFEEWLKKHIGTVHTFQGKEADEVIFVLGCDNSTLSAARWVNNNIVNVAITRAKYRLYVVGDYAVWKCSNEMKLVKKNINNYHMEQLKDLEKQSAIEKNKNLAEFIIGIQSKSIIVDDNELIVDDECGEIEMDENSLLNSFNLNVEYYNSIKDDVRNNIINGLKFHRLVKDISFKYKFNNLDYACCGIHFCKALEKHLKNEATELMNYLIVKENEKNDNVNEKKKKIGIIKVEKATIGSYIYIPDNYERIRNNIVDMLLEKNYIESLSQWNVFFNELIELKNLRNECCHSGRFTEESLDKLFQIMLEKKNFEHISIASELLM